MISTLEKEITFRFLKARKKDGFLNVISIFSFIGISLGVAVLIIVMSVMNGFRTELINKIVGFNSHITVQSFGDPIYKNSTKGVFLKGYLEKDFKELKITPFELSLFTIIASLELLSIKFLEIKPNLFFIVSSIKIFFS